MGWYFHAITFTFLFKKKNSHLYILPDSEKLSNQKLLESDVFRKERGVSPQGLNPSTLSKQSSITIPAVFWVTIGLLNFLHCWKVIPGDPIKYLPLIRQMVMNKSAFICNEIRHSQELCNYSTENKTRKKKGTSIFYSLALSSGLWYEQ